MKSHPRIRKTIKWGGAVVTVLLVVVWIGSGWWVITRGSRAGSFGIGLGGLSYNSWYAEFAVQYGPKAPHWSVMRSNSPWLGPESFHFQHTPQFGPEGFFIPLWPAAIAAGVATLAAWRLDHLARRRARAGFCPKCNYDRTGLAAGAVCPECGSAPRS